MRSLIRLRAALLAHLRQHTNRTTADALALAMREHWPAAPPSEPEVRAALADLRRVDLVFYAYEQGFADFGPQYVFARLPQPGRGVVPGVPGLSEQPEME